MARKAADDANAARLLMPSGVVSVAAFHVQQAIEKALKALLMAAAQDVRRIHDVATLADLARAYWPDLLPTPFPLIAVNEWYITTRYPGIEDQTPSVQEVEEALRTAESLIAAIAQRVSLALRSRDGESTR
jgi:HEPN domain-containing protein